MARILRSVGHGLFAAGAVLIIVYFAAAYLRGAASFQDAVDPSNIRTYLAILPLMPGTLLIWLADLVANRRHVAKEDSNS